MPLPPHDAHPLPSRRALREAERAAAGVPAARAARPQAPAPAVPPPAPGPVAPLARTAAPAPESTPESAPVPAPAPVPVVDLRTPAPRVVDLRDAPRRPAAAGSVADDVQAHLQLRPRAARPARAVAAERSTTRGAVPQTLPQPVTEHVLEGGDDAWVSDVAPRPTPVASRAVADDAPPAPATTRDRASAWRRLPQLLVVTALVAATVAYATAEDHPATAGEVRSYERAEQPVQAQAPSAGLAAEEDASGMVAGEDGLLRVTDEASRGAGRSVLPGCDGVPPETAQENGRIDEAYLCALWDGSTQIRADAAVSLTLLNEQYRARFGTDMCLTDGYRSYEAQVSVRARKPGLAARPGTSEHGFGLAVDLCGGVEAQGEGYWWLRENAAAFGWENPRWAQSGGGGPFEPWHWEYAAGQW